MREAVGKMNILELCFASLSEKTPHPAARASTLSPWARARKLFGHPPSPCKSTLLCALRGMKRLNTELTEALRALCAKALEAQRMQGGRWKSSTLIDVINKTVW
jgi:hypothetical protein